MRIPAAVILLTLVSCSPRPVVPPTADARYSEARRLLHSEHYDAALAAARAGLVRADQTGAATQRWKFRLLVIEVLLGQRRPDEAELELSRCGQAPQGKEWAEVRGWLRVLRGRMRSQQRKDEEAGREFEGAAEEAHEAGSQALWAEVRFRTGLLAYSRGEYENALPAFREAAEIAERLNERYLHALALADIGVLSMATHRNEEAIPWSEKAIALFAELGAAESAASINGNLGLCYWALGDYENAQLHFRIAQDTFAKTGDRDSQQLWIGNATNVLFELGEYVAAENGYRRALEIARTVGDAKRIGLWLANLAATEAELGKWNDAASYYAEAVQTLRAAKDLQWDQMLAVTVGRIAEGRGDVREARRLFGAALRVSGDDASALLDAHAGLARVNIREGLIPGAEAEFRRTLSIIEASQKKLVKDENKVSYLASLIRFYHEYVAFLVASKQPEKALEVADASRARLLEERNGSTTAAKTFTATDYRALARRMDAVLFEYLLGPEKSWLWVIRPDGIRLHELPPRKEIKGLIESYRAVVTSGRNPLDAAADTGRRLYETLIAPGVAGPGRYVIVPDQDLYSFNLEALPKPDDPHKFWLEDATVSIAPSLNYLAASPRGAATQEPTGLLAMGNATGATPQYPKLEFAGQELESVAKTSGGAETVVLQGDAATPQAYASAQPKKFRYIHFAAHAAANQQTPLDSAVILTGPPEKSRLLARHVMSIPLAAELVTISACRSAGGKTYAGEGLVGFAWAFLRAGAHNVIAGLWDVSDRSTAQLMGSLYGHIAAGKTPPEALHAAKLELIHTAGGTWAKPFYWAPFQVYVGRAPWLQRHKHLPPAAR